jgi:hypothetical protein
VVGNPPKRFELTHGNLPPKVKKRAANDPVRAVRFWDKRYRQRVVQWRLFLATEPEFIDLNDPPQLCPADMLEVFGRIPSTRNPPKISIEELSHLLRIVTKRDCSLS